MKMLFVGNILPIEVVDILKLSIAGKKYELALTQALNEIIGDDLQIVSASKIGREESKRISNSFVFPGKKFIVLINLGIPIINDIISNIHFFLIILFWSILNLGHKRILLILNSPFGLCFSSLLLKYLLGVKLVSLTIDTPFAKENDFKGIIGFYHKTGFKLGHKILKFFSGIILINRGVLDLLSLSIPHHITSVGFDEKRYNSHLNNKRQKTGKNKNDSYKVVYAGTLMHSKGISNLMEAFKLIDNKSIELNLYGYGPLENEALEYSKHCNNIKFYGRINYDKLQLKLAEADLLINPILINDPSHDFGFPSKLTDYILSGSPVLTTRFKSLPESYLSFLFFIEVATPEGISKAICSVYQEPYEIINDKVNQGINYITNHQNWNTITEDILLFIKGL